MSAMTVGLMRLWMEYIWESLKHVDVSGYFMVGLMILLLIILMSCRLVFVDTILRVNFLSFGLLFHMVLIGVRLVGSCA